MIQSDRLIVDFVVRPTVLVNGSDAGISINLLSLTVKEAISGPARCEITLNNWSSGTSPGYLYLDRRIIDFGKDIEARFADVSIFKGRISAIEAIYPGDAAPQLLILAEDRMQQLGMGQYTRFFSNETLSDVFQQIASAHGLASDIDFPSPTLPILAQLNESDLAFISRLSEQYNLSVRVFDNSLKVRPREGTGDAIYLELSGDLRSFRVRADLAEQRTSLTVSGWDVNAKEKIRQETTDAILQPELNGGDSGASILQSAFDENKEILFFEQIDNRQARALSQAAFLQRARRFVTGSGLAVGNPNLRAGSIVEINGLGEMFNGRYEITSVCHRIDNSAGYTTEIEIFRADIGFSS